MALLRVPDKQTSIGKPEEVKAHLASIGIGYERWDTDHDIGEHVPAEAILETFAREIEELKRSGGYVTADVIDVHPDTPNLDAMLSKFNKEHWHDEDEVRFIIEGAGVFHINPKGSASGKCYNNSQVVAVEVGKGDLLRVPAGTWHWFDLCQNRRIRAIRLFQDPSGWTPHYTESGVDKGYMPVCFGLHFIPAPLQAL